MDVELAKRATRPVSGSGFFKLDQKFQIEIRAQTLKPKPGPIRAGPH